MYELLHKFFVINFLSMKPNFKNLSKETLDRINEKMDWYRCPVCNTTKTVFLPWYVDIHVNEKPGTVWWEYMSWAGMVCRNCWYLSNFSIEILLWKSINEKRTDWKDK